MPTSSIYVIAPSISAFPCKIGFSSKPEARLRQLQTAQPEELRIFHTQEVDTSEVRRLERAVHDTIGYKRARGEWFNVSADEAIAEIKHALIYHSNSRVL